MNKEHFENFKRFLIQEKFNPATDYRSAIYDADIKRRVDFIFAQPGVSSDFELAMLIVSSYPNLMVDVAPSLKADSTFILAAFNENKYTYQYASEEIKSICGPIPQNRVFVRALLPLGTPSPSEEFSLIKKKLEAYALVQREKRAIEEGLAQAKENECHKPKAKFKL